MDAEERFFEMLRNSRRSNGQTNLSIVGVLRPEIVTERGERIEYSIVGVACSRIINSIGEDVAVIRGTLTERICDCNGAYTGFYIVGVNVRRICHESAA